MDETPLTPIFPAATEEQWRSLVDKVLKGGDFSKRLVSRTYEGIDIQPLYPKAEGERPRALRAGEGPWGVTQRVDHPDPAEANRLALADLEGGADGLALVFAGAASGRGFGVDIRNLDDLKRTLDGVMLDLVRLRLETAPFAGRQTAALVAAFAQGTGVATDKLAIDFGLDPVGDMARAGGAPVAVDALFARFADTVKALREAGVARTLVRIDARAVHESAGTAVHELAYTLATAVEYLRRLEAAGIGLDDARKLISVLLAADDDQFLTMAKFRAARLLWARVEEACGLAPAPLALSAETAWRMTSQRDPWVNMLRVTVATFAAGLGSADDITVLPLSSALGLPDGFTRRMARNTQLILLEESNLWRVADPAAGAGGIESLTEQLATKAWAAFQAIEAAGGIVPTLAAGTLQKEIAETRAARAKAIASRKDAITGTSEFPNVFEAPVETLQPAARPAAAAAVSPAASFGELVEAATSGKALPLAGAAASAVTFEALPSVRDAQAFEALRDRADAVLAKTGTRPKVFLANLGPIAAFTARATFAKNYFEAGGIETIGNDGFPDLAELVKAYKASGAAAACLCSSDDQYAALAADAAKALKAAGAARLYLAGRPGELEAALNEAGVDRFVFVGSDLVASLSEALA